MLKISLRSFALIPALLLLSSNDLWAQSNLTLSSGTAQSGGAVSLALSLSSSGASPAAFQWTFTYPNTISNFNVSAGPALTSAGKTITCAGNSFSYICVASGMNTNTISAGVVATVTATLSGSNSAAIGALNGVAVSTTGSALSLTSSGGVVTVPATAITVSGITCNPSTLGPGASSTCSVTVSASTGATVNLSSSSGMLSVPASVTIPAGSSVATFSAAAGQFSANQSPTITASSGGVSQTATLSLVSQPTVSSVQCAVASLPANATSSCTVMLSKPALASTSVALASTNAALVVPASVVVPAGAGSATFNIASSNISSSQAATITGSLNGSSASFTLSVVGASPGLVSLNCTPTILAAGGSSSCTVTLSNTSPSSSSVLLSSNNNNVSVPAGVAVAGGSLSAVFNVVVAGNFSTDQTAIISAALNSSVLSASLNLVAPTEPALVSALTCIPASLGSNSSSNCTVALTKPAPAGGTLVAISNTNNSVLTAPGSITVNAGAATAVFVAATGKVSNDQNATLTAAAGSSSASAVIGLSAPALVSALTCVPATLASNASTSCTVTLTKPAPVGGTLVTLSNASNALAAPASLTVSAGTATAVFNASTGTLLADQNATLTASADSSSVSAVIALAAPALVSSLSCTPASLGSNSFAACTVTLTKPAPSGGTLVTISNTNDALTAPASIAVNAGAVTGAFTASTVTLSADQVATLTASVGSSSVSAVIGLGTATLVSSLVCTPATLGSNDSANCTVTLTKPAPSAGTLVTISNTNNALTAPASVTVNAGAATAVFTASTGTLLADQNATLTALAGSSSVSAVVGLAAPAVVSSLSCTPASLQPQSSGLCAVVLTKPAPSGGLSITLTSDVAGLGLPQSVIVPAAASSAAFTVTTAAISSDQIATLTAKYGSVTVTTDLSLLAPTLISGITCNPASLGANNSSSCTVTLSKTAGPGGAAVVVSTTNSLLTAPSLLTIAGGAASASFTLQAGSFTTTQNGSVSVAYNGSLASASVQLLAGMFVSAIACSPNSISSGSTSLCTATLSQPASSGTNVTISSSSPLLTVPPSILVQAGSTTLTFSATAGTITADTAATVTASLGASSQSTNLALTSLSALSTITCTSVKIAVGASAACIVTLSKPTTGVFITLASSDPALVVPTGLAIPQGATSSSFTAVAQSMTTGSVSISASYNGATKTVAVTIVSANTTSSLGRLTCHPNSLQAGTRGRCRLTLRDTGALRGTEVHLRTSSASVQLPVSLRTRPGQSWVEFHIDAAADAAEPVVVEAQAGSEIVQDTIAITPDPSQALRVPGNQYVKYGDELRFRVSASDPTAVLSTGALPPGAYFDPAIAEFHWIPDATEVGAHDVQFTATGAQTTATVKILVETGEPAITGIVNAASRSQKLACSPGAIATVLGRWLTPGAAASDASGASFELAGTKVLVNGVAAPLLSASPTQLDFLCPQALPGSSLQVEVQADHGISLPVQTTAVAAAPGIFSLDAPGGQGAVLLEDHSGFAAVRNYRFAGQPALPGEHLTVLATGIEGMTNIAATLGDLSVTPQSINGVPGRPGLFQVVIAVPNRAADGDISLSLTGDAAGEIAIRSNVVHMAVEGNDR